MKCVCTLHLECIVLENLGEYIICYLDQTLVWGESVSTDIFPEAKDMGQQIKVLATLA